METNKERVESQLNQKLWLQVQECASTFPRETAAMPPAKVQVLGGKLLVTEGDTHTHTRTGDIIYLYIRIYIYTFPNQTHRKRQLQANDVFQLEIFYMFGGLGIMLIDVASFSG